jgi:quinol monooxygenase YgiN
MIIRIVKMTFLPEKAEEFVEIFNSSKDKIRTQQGCLHLELWNDVNDPYTFFTYSHWENEEALNAYRKSSLFADVWPRTKKILNKTPEAWSVNQISVTNNR